MSAQVISLADLFPPMDVVQRRANALDSLGDALQQLCELEDAVATVGAQTEPVSAYLTNQVQVLIRDFRETIRAHGGRA